MNNDISFAVSQSIKLAKIVAKIAKRKQRILDKKNGIVKSIVVKVAKIQVSPEEKLLLQVIAREKFNAGMELEQKRFNSRIELDNIYKDQVSSEMAIQKAITEKKVNDRLTPKELKAKLKAQKTANFSSRRDNKILNANTNSPEGKKAISRLTPFELCYTKYFDMLVNNIMFKRNQRFAVAQDMVQAGFINVYEVYIEKLDMLNSFSPSHMLRLVRSAILHKLLDFIRLQKNNVVNSEVEIANESFLAPDQVLRMKSIGEAISEALYTLKGLKRDILTLHLVEGYNTKEICDFLTQKTGKEVTSGYVLPTIMRGKKDLQKILMDKCVLSM